MPKILSITLPGGARLPLGGGGTPEPLALHLNRDGTRLVTGDQIAEGDILSPEISGNFSGNLQSLAEQVQQFTLVDADTDEQIGAAITTAGLRGATALTVPALASARVRGRLGGGTSVVESIIFDVVASVVSDWRAAVRNQVTGRDEAGVLKDPATDPLPTGWAWDGTPGVNLLVTQDNPAALEDWKITGTIRGVFSGVTIRHCEFAFTNPAYDDSSAKSAYPIEIGPGQNDWLVERNTLYIDAPDNDAPRGPGSLILLKEGCERAVLRNNYLYGFPNDGAKLDGTDYVFEFNRFGQPRNIPVGIQVYDPTVFYPVGTYVMYPDANIGSKAYRKNTTAPAGTEPIDTTDTSLWVDWDRQDPHTDIVTITGGLRGTYRYNHHDTMDSALFIGATQQLRSTRNTGSPNPIEGILIYGNVFEPWPGFWPTSTGVTREVTTKAYNAGDFAKDPNTGVTYVSLVNMAKSDALAGGAHVLGTPGSWDPTRDTNHDLPVVWAHNEIGGGANGGHVNGANGFIAWTGNTDNGSPVVAPENTVIPTIPELTYGEAMAFTLPTLHGPASGFIVTPTAYASLADSAGARIDGACVFYIGETLAGWIRDNGEIAVNPLAGVTIAGTGGGSYRIEVFDIAGAPDASGILKVGAGAATVTVDSAQAASGPAWGTGDTTPAVRVLSISAQSQLERGITKESIATSTIPKPTLVSNEGLLTVYTDPHGTGVDADNPEIVATVVNQTSVDAGEVNPAMAAISDLLAYRMPGKPIVIVDLAVPGTGFASLADNSDLDRLFSHYKAMIDQVEADGTPITDNAFCWMGNDAAEAKTYHASFLPVMTGRYVDGTSVVLGQPNRDSVRNKVIDHLIYDSDQPADTVGPNAAFARSKVKTHFLGWPTFNPREVGDPEMLNSTETGDGSFAGYSVQVDRPARDQVYSLLNDPHMAEMKGWHGPSMHIARMSQDSASGTVLSTHPDYREPDGLVQFMWPVALLVLKLEGDPLARNIRLRPKSRASDGTWVRLEAIDSDGNAMRPEDAMETLRRMRDLPPPTVLPPHWQEVMGFEIRRAGDADADRRFLWREGAGRDDAYTGTAVIREKDIAIFPKVPFADDDGIEFLRGEASTVLLEDRDADARLYLDMPMIHVPELYQLEATYPMPGIPIEPQPPLMRVGDIAIDDADAPAAPTPPAEDTTPGGGGGEVTATVASRASGDTHFTHTGLAGTRKYITAEAMLDIPLDAKGGAHEIMEPVSSGGIRVWVDDRTGKRAVFVAMEASDDSTPVFTTALPNDTTVSYVYSADGAFPAGMRKLVFSATQDDNAGNAQIRVWVDDVLVINETAPAILDKQFTSRGGEVFRETAPMSFKYVRAWEAYSSSGDMTGVPLKYEILAADANAPTGVARAGVGDWTLT